MVLALAFGYVSVEQTEKADCRSMGVDPAYAGVFAYFVLGQLPARFHWPVP
jgi:hypothetical protein